MKLWHSPEAATRTCHVPRSCANCRHFRADPGAIEAAIPGLIMLGSGYASVRSDDGLCEYHARYLSSTSSCGQHEALGKY